MPHHFRTEHYSALRAGEKVRTVRRGGHVVRIAFPHGRRVKGSGRVLEVLHPLREQNPCRLGNPAELVVMMANPSQLKGASELYEQFHGEPGQHIDEIHEPSPRAAAMADLGELIELQVKRSTGWKWGLLDFKDRGVRLAANADGTQLFFVDGDQKISRGELTELGANNRKELIDLGEAMMIAYRARKMHVNGAAADYEHKFGEESGIRPRLGYDRRGGEPRLFLSGGDYRVESGGIIN